MLNFKRGWSDYTPALITTFFFFDYLASKALYMKVSKVYIFKAWSRMASLASFDNLHFSVFIKYNIFISHLYISSDLIKKVLCGLHFIFCSFVLALIDLFKTTYLHFPLVNIASWTNDLNSIDYNSCLNMYFYMFLLSSFLVLQIAFLVLQKWTSGKIGSEECGNVSGVSFLHIFTVCGINLGVTCAIISWHY